LPLKPQSCNLNDMDEIVFEVTQEGDEGFVAECLTENIVTQTDDCENVRQDVKEAVAAYYFASSQKPARIRLQHVRDEVLAHP
jgi:predicted RNase H-like HicB family nuclease